MFIFSLPFLRPNQSIRGLVWSVRVRSFAFYTNVDRPRFWASKSQVDRGDRFLLLAPVVQKEGTTIQYPVDSAEQLGTGCEVFLWVIILRKSAF